VIAVFWVKVDYRLAELIRNVCTAHKKGAEVDGEFHAILHCIGAFERERLDIAQCVEFNGSAIFLEGNRFQSYALIEGYCVLVVLRSGLVRLVSQRQSPRSISVARP